jgi:two-component system, NtrC family, sensor kinase
VSGEWFEATDHHHYHSPITTHQIEGAIEVRVPALGEAATQLPWLCPCAASLLALARSPAGGAWSEIRHDPAALLLVLREAGRTLASPALSFFPSVLRDPGALRGALHYLSLEERRQAGHDPLLPACNGQLNCSIDWSRSSNRQIYRACFAYARTAQRLAECTGRCDPDNAWVTAFLAPLGWLAICAIDTEKAASCLADPQFAADPDSSQRHYWGSDQDAIARRLLRRWQVPRWLAAVVGHLGLKVEIAQNLGADADLFRMVQLAVGLAQQHGQGLSLRLGTSPAENAAVLALPAREQETLGREFDSAVPLPRILENCTSPLQIPLLREVLLSAVENQQLRDAPILEELENERDRLHHALERQQTGETERLQVLKLEALAEFAAGAAHEINNPLAVISGQAQYLMGHDSDPERQQALRTIVIQAQRIHQLLSDLMQFARPARPQRQLVDIRGLLREVALSLSDLAGEKEVRLVLAEPEHGFHLFADSRQVRTALECLLRNAIEAAPASGWASLRVGAAGDRLEFVVEDNGTAPSPAQAMHLFDPFYSGRLAGRGRGLGLPTAWRLARENGGEVRWDETAAGPTRFTLSLPHQVEDNGLTAEARLGDAGQVKKFNGSALPVRADI